MRLVHLLAVCALAAGCASRPPALPADALFDDGLWPAPVAAPATDRLFELNADMRRFLEQSILPNVQREGPHGALARAMYDPSRLRIEYDARRTRSAAETFDARAGNCMSLVVMTAAFAKAMNVEARYRVSVDFDSWGRQADLLVHTDHVNISVGPRFAEKKRGVHRPALTIDFLPAEQVAGLRTREIPESTLIALYLNNRAVEALLEGRLHDAYAFSREALRLDAGFAGAANTLGVAYLRAGHLARAESAFRHALAQDAAHPRALTNLATVLDRRGLAADAAAVREQLARVQPDPPYRDFELGRAAATRGDWRAARDLFEREARRAEANPEFHHWLAVAHLQLGDAEAARRELALAVQTSHSRDERERYAGKLARLAEAASAVR